MAENSLTDNFVEWVSQQLQAHKDDVAEELKTVPKGKSLAITIKLKLKNIGSVFSPSYSFAIPRAAVKSEGRPEKQLELPMA